MSLRSLILLAACASCGSAVGQFTFPGGVTVQIPGQRQSPVRVPRQAPGRPDPDKICPPLLAWERQLFTEYPSTDLRRTMAGKVEEIALPLFADDGFVHYFRKSYTSLSPDELDAIHRDAVACVSSTYRSQFQVLPSLMAAFETRGNSRSLSPGRLAQQLPLLAQTRNLVASDKAALASLPATAESAAPLQRIRDDVAPNLHLLWPSERAAFEQNMAAAQARLTLPIFVARVQPLLTAPESTQTLLSLQNARNDCASLPSHDRDEWGAKIDSRYNTMLQSSLSRERSEMLTFKGGPEGLQKGADWYTTFQSTYVGRLNAPGAADISAQYLSLRQKQLAAMEPALRRKIDTSKSPDGLTALVDDSYRWPSDRSTESYSRMQQAVGARVAFFEKEESAAQAKRDAAEARRQAKLTAGDANAPPAPKPRAVSRRVQSAPPEDSSASEAAVNASAFSAHGLSSEAAMNALYRGDFDKVDFERDDLQFAGLSSGYMDAYWEQCREFLTRDRTEITVQRCTGGYSHWVNGYGVQTSPDTCNGWSTEGTGKFADRSLYNSTKALEGQMTKKMLATTLGSMTKATSFSDFFTGPVNQASAISTLKDDAGSVIRLNGCTSPNLKRFQTNLLAFAAGKPGIQLDGSSVRLAATEGAAPGGVYKDSDYSRLLDDMVSRQAEGWLMNRYAAGSISGVRVTNRDELGRPAKLQASYGFSGMSGKTTGSVTLTFNDGLPECLYFSDLPNNCVTPSRQLITAYGKGEYRRDH